MIYYSPNEIHFGRFRHPPEATLCLFPMADRDRRGMLIKNTGTTAAQVAMASRVITIGPGEEEFITPEEVRDPKLREALQIRAIAIVRPATKEEDEALANRLS